MDVWVDAAMYAAIFGAIIGAYILVIKYMQNTTEELGRIYAVVNGHIQDRVVHPEKQDISFFVTKEVCSTVQLLHEAHFAELKNGLTRVDSNVIKLVDKLL